MTRETKIDWFIFALAAAFCIFALRTRLFLDKWFDDMVPKGEAVEAGPMETLFHDVIEGEDGP